MSISCLLYTSLNVDASKTAGQGFGSATGQYLDLYIKFDTRTLTGYASVSYTHLMGM